MVATLATVAWMACSSAWAQVPPSTAERQQYKGLFAAADRGDVAGVQTALRAGERVDARDGHQRTPLHVATYAGHHDAMRALVKAGADPNALDKDRYDIVTIAAVANDLPTLELALKLGGSARNVTSPYDGTALIASAHRGQEHAVRTLIAAGAPLDHVNNLGWTAVIEAIVLGNGTPRYVATLKLLIDAGANVNLPDRQGRTPLALARERKHEALVALLEKAGAR
jgi:ankyrin repeat protein